MSAVDMAVLFGRLYKSRAWSGQRGGCDTLVSMASQIRFWVDSCAVVCNKSSSSSTSVIQESIPNKVKIPGMND